MSPEILSPEKVLSPLIINEDKSITVDQARMLFKAASHKSSKEEIHAATGVPVNTDSDDSMSHFFTEKPVDTKSEFVQGSSKDINIAKDDSNLSPEVKMSDALSNANIAEDTKTS